MAVWIPRLTTILSPTRGIIGVVEVTLLQEPIEPDTSLQQLAGGPQRPDAPIMLACGCQRDPDLQAASDVSRGEMPPVDCSP
jgi:hypothetical protein